MATPKISVVIAAYNVENFIVAAVKSALTQDPPFHEVIVINDGSSDDTLRLITQAVSGHPSAIQINCPSNIGLGALRNLGTARASGDYIAYLDGDDLFSPQAHQIMQDALVTSPDLAIINHSRLYEHGSNIPNKLTRLLAPHTHRTADEKIKLFQNLNVAWNKVCKRSFVDRIGLTFPDGKYEDIAWNYAALIMAHDIVTTPEIAVTYRQRPGSILRSTNRSHFDIFDRWEELWEMLDAHPELKKIYSPSLELRRFNSLTTVLDNPERLPKSAKLEFAKRIDDVCHPRDKLAVASIGRADMLLGSRLGYVIRQMHRSNIYAKLRKTVFALPARLKLWTYHNVFLRLPVDQTSVVYESYWGKKVDCNPYAIFQHLEKTAPDAYTHVWIVRDGVDLQQSATAVHVHANSLKYFYYMARARYLVTNANFPNKFVKRPGTTHVQTKHGTPLKYMGLDILEKDPAGLGSARNFAKRCKRWDYVISSNPYSSDTWREGFPYQYRVLETGYPRNDMLVTASDADRAAVRDMLGLPRGKKVVLYAPTFRPQYPDDVLATHPDKDQIVSAIMAGLDAGSVLAIRDHYFLPPDSTWADDPRIVDLSAHASTTDVLLATDMLITDYSSIMFDFAVQKRPIIVFAYDRALYADLRGMYFDISKEHPGVYCETLSELETALKSDQSNSPQARAKLEAFHAKFCPWDDGHAAARACDIIFSTAP